MAKIAPFEQHASQYEDWFGRHYWAYVSELLALRPFVPLSGRGLEVGVGSGRFAAPLGIQVGIDPSHEMLARAAARGIEVCEAVAESLPFADDSFEHALVVTTICFVDSPRAMLNEIRRVLIPGGTLVIGFIDRESRLGRHYEAHRADDVFYRDATFYSANEVAALLTAGGFSIQSWAQTLARPLEETQQIEPVRPGHDTCAFVVLQARNDKRGPWHQR
jgi:SAM-dependent methyltransferase